jgi:hypothetical protein
VTRAVRPEAHHSSAVRRYMTGDLQLYSPGRNLTAGPIIHWDDPSTISGLVVTTRVRSYIFGRINKMERHAPSEPESRAVQSLSPLKHTRAWGVPFRPATTVMGSHSWLGRLHPSTPSPEWVRRTLPTQARTRGANPKGALEQSTGVGREQTKLDQTKIKQRFVLVRQYVD